MHKQQRSHKKNDAGFGELVMAFRSRFPSIPCKSKPLPAIAYGYHGPPELENNRKRQDFLIKPKYQNKLPDIPCDPKHIVLPAHPNDYELTGRELNVIYKQFTDGYSGGKLDVIGECFRVKPSKSIEEELHSVDRFLLEDDDVKDKHEQMKRSVAHKKKVSWLRRPEYMVPETCKFNRPIGEKLEFRMHNAINKKFKCEGAWEDMDNLWDKKARVNRIEEIFEDARLTISNHPCKPNVYAEEVIPLFPDVDSKNQMVFEVRNYLIIC
ncbi:RNA polymerase II-associated factor 1 [Orchesella cincta]|uniref:RNA polymerase II-associated factor 1 homolog n=1 Tax=Orchesella cincta TaxID=48709 RepID=A0A1D2NL78_ORCCI|nr:RNA polymerase II-associated factor 1 [Orchesella cincta]